MYKLPIYLKVKELEKLDRERMIRIFLICKENIVEIQLLFEVDNLT